MPNSAPLAGTVNGERDDAPAISTSFNPDAGISTSSERSVDGSQIPIPIPIPIQANNELGDGRKPKNHDETSRKQDLDESIRPLCNELAAKVNAFLDEKPHSELLRHVQEQTRVALGVISTALERFSLDEISISYNGGKDCLVLLILFLAALSAHPSPLPRALQSVYIISPHPFAEVTSFVDETSSTYQLDLSRYALPMKAGFAKYLTDRSKVKAIMVGTRRTDPHGSLLGHFNMTDHGWVDFMRVHPVIDWHYREIWAFIRHLHIPYCPLYDQGYTSLGGTTDTHPNPALALKISPSAESENMNGDSNTNHEGARVKKPETNFLPAYELIEDQAERLGRDW